MKHEVGECERCGEENVFIVLSLEGMICYQCDEDISIEDEEE